MEKPKRLIKGRKNCGRDKKHGGMPFVALAVYNPACTGIKNREWSYYLFGWEGGPLEPLLYQCHDCFVEELVVLETHKPLIPGVLSPEEEEMRVRGNVQGLRRSNRRG